MEFKGHVPGAPVPPVSLMEHIRGKWARKVKEARIVVGDYGGGSRELRQWDKAVDKRASGSRRGTKDARGASDGHGDAAPRQSR